MYYKVRTFDHLKGLRDFSDQSYVQDYGLNRAVYIQRFMKAINWPVVEQRFTATAYNPGQVSVISMRRAS